ncbi:MAG: hypothetical protein FJ134_07910 [Deltaproteobacteria bacterium]|nr:hypothetical protein [Deltaproteobacteria bacterium]
MTIVELLAADGFPIKKVASTGGGEYAGPCPFCGGGNDRLRCWPEQGHGGRWWCRQCGRFGDCIEYLKVFRKMSFKVAAQFVGKQLKGLSPSFGSGNTLRTWTPRETIFPTNPWQTRAKRLVEASERELFLPHTFAQRMLGWLKEHRGLSEETIKKFRLGLVPIDRWEGYEQWGLEPDLKADGNPKKIWLPRGLCIPLCNGGNILRIRIRRPKMDLKSGKDRRYYTIRGSDSRAVVLEPRREIQMVVESDLDAMLVVQEAHGLVGAISLGTAGKTPDEEAVKVLGHSRLILVSLDSDDAGAKAAWQWWLNHFSQARRWPPVGGKDPGDMRLAGVNVRDWIEAGIAEYRREEEDQMECPRTLDPDQVLSTMKGQDAEAIFYLADKPQTPERFLTCYECGHFIPAANSLNPTQAWGHCRKRNRGRYGVATACEALLECETKIMEVEL